MFQTIKEKLRNTGVYNFVGSYLQRRRARAFDKKYNVETAREVKLRELKIDSPNVNLGEMYAGTDPKSFKSIFNGLAINFEDFVFVDLGSGKGRVLLMASDFPFKEIIGVEFSPELNETANRNIASYKNSSQKCRRIESIHQDAVLFALPPHPTVFYIFNPFKPEIFSKMLGNIEKSLAENPREIYFVCANPFPKQVFEGIKNFKKFYADTWYSIFNNIDSVK